MKDNTQISAAEATRQRLIALAEKALAPCLWHGVDGATQPKGGFHFCAQCERRSGKVCIDPQELLDALNSESADDRRFAEFLANEMKEVPT